MSKNLATRRLLGILITCVMITSCSGGTSSNTPPIYPTEPTEPPEPPQTLTITVPSLGYVATVDRNTTFGEINSTATDLTGQCVDRFGLSQQGTTCRAEVQAAQREAVRFINQAN
ncbi:hypothetical protein PN465_02505 [Nodularia spumigena CS-584]|uniref:hypothetical protein n=1 Tax=Nodularia spumigena TaxID=70799 RepID=UPI0000EA96B5|nr:hypothetical protein [Nodularia spumigena]AHJ29374.1 hypothetical protein NSP_30470 [Nodularia spumigena CCY9414]EAW42754.1 hypothetical protein N9414_01020 [Nodularia spumigena CCY9414]MDB9381113.1 hypothetical protein [Nodularia spumigena CS-584]